MANLKNFYSYLGRNDLDVKQHQLEGVSWCLKNEQEGTQIGDDTIRGGLMADEMGLGKTMQMIGVMVCNIKLHTLIILPRALIEQWTDVIKKTLGHSPLVYHGRGIKNIGIEELKKAPIVISSYGMISLSKEQNKNLLHDMKWDRIIYDEAHHLRNSKTSVHYGARIIKSDITWLVTGTPIQNKKNDFYSLCSIIGIPEKYYVANENLMDLVKKFIIKRTKKDAHIELPELRINNILVEWSNANEKALAEEIHSMLNFSRVGKSHLDASMAALGGETMFKILPLLVRARQACIYPALMQENVNQLVEAGLIEESLKMVEGLTCSSKIDTVVSKILERKNNNKAKLIFCHYRGEIDVLKNELGREGLNVKTFDGRVNTSARSDILTQKCDVLILQIQTGCEGLNLQHFSEIYFISPHWNPAIEDQAIARCHRIGQESEIDVFRFRMVAFDDDLETRTIDEYSSDVQDAKREVMTMIN